MNMMFVVFVIATWQAQLEVLCGLQSYATPRPLSTGEWSGDIAHSLEQQLRAKRNAPDEAHALAIEILQGHEVSSTRRAS